MESILRHADPTFQAVMQLDPRQPPSKFRNAHGYLVDLVIQPRTKTQSNPVPLPGLDAGAAPLQYLAWLIENPVPTVALWGAGIPVMIPQPARFAVHKLILAQRRAEMDRLKRAKDLAQADAIMTARYVHDPFALEDALEDARARQRGLVGADRPLARRAGTAGPETLTSALPQTNRGIGRGCGVFRSLRSNANSSTQHQPQPSGGS